MRDIRSGAGEYDVRESVGAVLVSRFQSWHCRWQSRDMRAVRAVRRRVFQGFELFSFLFPSS